MKSMKEIQEEEERAARHHAPVQDDPMLFWDYGGSQDPSKAVGSRCLPPPPPPPARPPGMTAAAIAARGVVSSAVPAPKGGWAAAALVGKVMVPPLAPAPPTRPSQAVASKQPASAVSRQTEPAALEQPSISDSLVLMVGDMALSSEFRDWCREQLRKLTGSDDLSLVEVILTMQSRSEVAETCNITLGNKTGEDLNPYCPCNPCLLLTSLSFLLNRRGRFCGRVLEKEGRRGAANPTGSEEKWEEEKVT